MKEIKLTRGYTALIDDEDAVWASQHSWHASVDLRRDGTVRNVYASTSIGGKERLLHRLIKDVTDPVVKVDHKDHNGLNCQRINLRISDNKQNCQNQRAIKKYKGTCFHKRSKKWQAQIKLDKIKHLGCFDTQEEAALAYDAAAREHFGEFAYLNFPD